MASPFSRRRLIRLTLAAGAGSLWPAQRGLGLPLAGLPGTSVGEGPMLAGTPPVGELLGVLPFLDEGPPVDSEPSGRGLAGRLVFDLSALDRDRLVVSAERFFIRTRTPARLPPLSPWSIRLEGLAGRAVDLGLGTLENLGEDQGAHLLECSGNGRHRRFGLMSSAEWAGVPLLKLLERERPQPGATRVLIRGNDAHPRESGGRRGAAWVFTPEQLEETGAFFALRLNGEPLPSDHGAPVRLIVPGWYGCCSIKWVESLRWVGDEERATSQMREFAGRTHQPGHPELASDYQPAEIDLAALPVRVERWRTESGITYNIVGILWGGKHTTDRLQIRLGDGPWTRVESYQHRTTRTWTLWTHRWRPEGPGRYEIALRVEDPGIMTRRLDRGYYSRVVDVPVG